MDGSKVEVQENLFLTYNCYKLNQERWHGG